MGPIHWLSGRLAMSQEALIKKVGNVLRGLNHEGRHVIKGQCTHNVLRHWPSGLKWVMIFTLAGICRNVFGSQYNIGYV